MKRVLFFLLTAISCVSFVSCEKVEEKNTITLYNQFWTDASVTVNGVTKQMPFEGSVSYEIASGETINFKAVTKGTNGYEITLTNSQPITMDSKDMEFDVDVPADYFFFMIGHDKAGKADITDIVIDNQDGDIGTFTVSFPQDEFLNDVGYFKTTTGKITVKAGLKTDFWLKNVTEVYGFSFSGEANQGLELYTSKLINLKKSNQSSNRKSLPVVATAK